MTRRGDDAGADGAKTDGGETDDVKAAARAEAYARRKQARADAPTAGEEAAELFLRAVELEAGEIVAGYRPIRTEIDPTPLMIALHERVIRLCVPVVVGDGKPLQFKSWTPDAKMVAGAFGAEVPADGEICAPTVLIAPMLAFDRAGYRLGYGGGFYDRTLAELRAARPTRAIGFSYAGQEMPEVPRGPFDARLDGIVTEREAIWPPAEAA